MKGPSVYRFYGTLAQTKCFVNGSFPPQILNVVIRVQLPICLNVMVQQVRIGCGVEFPEEERKEWKGWVHTIRTLTAKQVELTITTTNSCDVLNVTVASRIGKEVGTTIDFFVAPFPKQLFTNVKSLVYLSHLEGSVPIKLRSQAGEHELKRNSRRVRSCRSKLVFSQYLFD